YGVLGLSEQPELRMGTFVHAEIEGAWMENVVVLPRAALRDGNTVLVASPEKELEIRTVEIIRSEPQVIYVSGGLNNGEQVIISSIEAPIPGSKLVIAGEREATDVKTNTSEVIVSESAL
ncbi:MAG: hypothetical protein SH820_17000, partial [Xanthomonadales bacterium]|nr:hypothetical protein [Xanthomonadales bacterium]